jgi:hypothetical protein
METTYSQSLEINKLTQAQFNTAETAGTLNANALYLTPEQPLTITFNNGSTEGTNKFTYDGSVSKTINLPVGSTNTSSKIYLIGATSQTTAPASYYSHDTAYVGSDGCLYSGSLKVLTSHQTIKQDGVTGATVTRFCTCSTAAATAAKTVSSITNGTFSLGTGSRVTVKFTYANTANNPTLNVNSTGAMSIYHNGSQITTGTNKALLAGTCDFVYDGTQWQLVGNYIDTTSSDTKVTQAYSTTSNSYPLLMSATSGVSSTSSRGATTAIVNNQLYANPSTGQLTAKTFYATSDKRLKENFVEYTPNKSVLNLPVYKYNFITDETKTTHVGCLAQDLYEICPEAVSEDPNGYLSINESKIVYLLLDEVKKLKAEVEELKTKA